MSLDEKSAALRWPTLLCIDDDPQIHEAIQLRLREYKVDVIPAFHGMHGFWLAMSEHPDLIITDMRMPQGPGDYVVECLRDNPVTRDIPVIIITGVRDKALERKMYGLGATRYLTKPVQFETLRDELAKHLKILAVPA